jgi:hypothetical protein
LKEITSDIDFDNALESGEINCFRSMDNGTHQEVQNFKSLFIFVLSCKNKSLLDMGLLQNKLTNSRSNNNNNTTQQQQISL